jgi:hypothetical protein
VLATESAELVIGSEQHVVLFAVDELMAQAQAEFARARPALEKVLGVPSEGTIVAEGKRISPALYVAQAEADKALDLLIDSAAAAKHRDFKEAAKLATEAKRHVDKGLSGLEALEPPDYDELQAYLKKTIDGYRLLSAGVARCERHQKVRPEADQRSRSES